MTDTPEEQEEADLVLDYGHGKATVEINKSHTLHDVRKLVLEEFDEYMFPQQDAKNWVFCVNDICITSKQETKKIAWKYLKGSSPLCIRSAGGAPTTTAAAAGGGTKRDAATSIINTDTITTSTPQVDTNKRPKIDEPTTKDKNAKGGDNSKTPSVETSTSTIPEVVDNANKRSQVSVTVGRHDVAADTMAMRAPIRTNSVGIDDGSGSKRKPKEPVWAAEASQEIVDVGVNILDISDDDTDEEGGKDLSGLLLVEKNPMIQPDLAFEKTKANLKNVKDILDDTVRIQRAFSTARREECARDVDAMLKAKRPQTIIGVYGGTGVGKSSLLNALLDEASVLPTSGSQGCTATVVELSFNSDLVLTEDKAGAQPKKVPVYRGEVEFMTKEDWESELRILVQECSTGKGRLYSAKPHEKSLPAAAAAWSKINQVYGGGTLERCYDMKGTDPKHNESNEADSEIDGDTLADEDAPEEKKDSEIDGDTLADEDAPEEKKETWATDRVFKYLQADERVCELLTPTDPSRNRNVIEIQEGLVEAGSDEAKRFAKPFAETSESDWLVKKHWSSTFQEKIDPFVYKNGSESDAQTWPLIRKVRLLGPWHVLSTGACLVDLPGVRDANAARAQVAEAYLEKCSNIWIVAPIKRAVDDGTAKDLMGAQFKRRLLMDGQYGNISFICTSTDKVEASETMRDHADIARKVPGRWEKMTDILETVNSLGSKDRRKCKKLQSDLKVLCAKVRNEYSKGRLQDDFRNGLREMYLKDCGGLPSDDQLALPASFSMDVFCTSANDYMKATGIKPISDGDPETFFDPIDTQIPLLRTFVHETTNNHCKRFVKNYVESAQHLIRKVELFASGAKYVAANEEIAGRLKASFDSGLVRIESKVSEISANFEREMQNAINANLKPALTAGAEKSKEAAMATLRSWGSHKKRTKTERNLERNGLVWSTYQATIRRNGQYTSKSVGLVDMNQELYDPMEKSFATDWQRIMGTTTNQLLVSAKHGVQNICDALVRELRSSFLIAGFENASLDALMTAATKASSTALIGAFERMDKASTRLQRKLTRSMLPKIKKRMISSYRAAANVECGTGKFERMKRALETTSGWTLGNMFAQLLSHMEEEVARAINAIANSILETATLLGKNLESFLGLSWDIDRAASPVCNELLSEIACLMESQKEASNLVEMDAGAKIDCGSPRSLG